MSTTSTEVSKNHSVEEMLKLIVLILLGFSIAFFYLNVRQIQWDVGYGLREVDARDIHKWGMNSFKFREESEPFTGVGIRWLSGPGSAKVEEKVFQHGMLHTKRIYDPQTSTMLFEIQFENEKVTHVSVYDKSGQLLAQGTEGSVENAIQKANLQSFYRADPN